MIFHPMLSDPTVSAAARRSFVVNRAVKYLQESKGQLYCRYEGLLGSGDMLFVGALTKTVDPLSYRYAQLYQHEKRGIAQLGDGLVGQNILYHLLKAAFTDNHLYSMSAIVDKWG